MCRDCDASEFGAVSHTGGRSSSYVAYLSPYTKLAILLAGLIVNLLSPSAVTSALLAVASLALLLGMGVGSGTLARRLAVPWYIALVAIATQVFMTGSSPIFQFGPLTGYSEGLARGLVLGGRVFAGGILVLGFSLTTSVTELVSLASRLRLSPVLIEIASLTYRYLFLVTEEGQRIREAQIARLGHSSWRKSVHSYGILIGMVMARSYDKAESVYQAMASRGYSGALPAESCRVPGSNDLAAGASALVVMIAIYWIGLGYGL